MAKKSIDFRFKVSDFSFTNDYCFKGGFKRSPNWKKVQFSYHIDERRVSNELDTPTERTITFKFTLTMLPDLGEISFNGKCILTSPEQQKVSIALQRAPKAIYFIADKEIRKSSLKHAEQIAKEKGIPVPPAHVMNQMFQINNKKKKK